MIQNKYNLPEPLISALENDPYSFDGDFSCTSLLLPPRILQLRKRHNNELHEDASDMIYRLLGQNTHHILERIDEPNCIKEKRYYANIYGARVGGRIDLYEETPKVLSDFKVTSVWSIINGIKPEHIAQMNILAYLMKLNGTSPVKLQIVNFLRDWSKHKAKDYGYPSCQVVVQNIPLWDDEKIKSWIEDRVRLHQSCVTMPDDELPPCTEQEMWTKATTYAVMQKGRKSAHRVLNSEQEAEQWIDDNNKGTYVEKRPGENIRCMSYCDCVKWCSLYSKDV